MRMLQHQTAAAASLFPVALVLHTLQLEQQVDPGLVRGHVYFLCLVDAKYRAIWLYLHCAGGGGVILWHLSCLCKELAVRSFSSSLCKQRDSRWEQQPWFRVASPVCVFWLTLSIHVLLGAASPSASATSLPLLGLMAPTD